MTSRETNTIDMFGIGDKVWLYQLGDPRYVYPAIVKSIDETLGIITVCKYISGLWTDRWAYPQHLAPRDFNLSDEIFHERYSTLLGE